MTRSPTGSCNSRARGGASLTGGHRLLAGLLAGAARLCADPAMLVVLRMLLALRGAQLAREHADIELAAQQLHLWLLLPRQNAPSRSANVTAILVEPDAAAEHVDLLFTETRVRACDARLRAIEASVDASSEALHGHNNRGGIGFDHLGRVHARPARNACSSRA